MTDMKTPEPPYPADVQAQAHDWLVRLHTGPVTAAEADAFRRWRALHPANAAAFAGARRLWNALAPALQASTAPVQEPLPAASAPLPSATPVLPVRRRPRSVNLGRRAFLGGAAAAVGWMAVKSPLGMWPELQALGADYRTATGERRDVTIGSVAVAMAARTTMSRPADGSAGIVVAQGEAQFALPTLAAAGFVIGVDGAQVFPAPGARVNVRCVGSDIRVTCLAGRADLVRGGRTVVLQPSWQARLAPDRIASVAPVPTDTIDAWRRGWLVFDDQPLQEVVDEINRYRPGRIVLTGEALPARRVQARIPLQRIDTFIDLVRDAYGAKVASMPGGIVLLS